MAENGVMEKNRGPQEAVSMARNRETLEGDEKKKACEFQSEVVGELYHVSARLEALRVMMTHVDIESGYELEVMTETAWKGLCHIIADVNSMLLKSIERVQEVEPISLRN